MKEQLTKLKSYKSELYRRVNENAIRYYRPHIKQRDFHRSTKRNRWLFGGNRTGKTVGGGAEAVYYATGTHPFKKIKTPNRGWVVSLTNEVQRDVAQKEVLRWLPKSEIADIFMRKGQKDNPESGIIDFIRLKNGSVIGFKSCDQGREKFQGTSQHWIWFDEEPPEDIYKECRMRVLDTRGDIWGTMTPLKGLTWVHDVVYINDIGDHNVQCWLMEWADNPHLSPEEIAQLESTMDEEDRESRQYGRFMAKSGLIYKEFDENIHVIDPIDIPTHWHSGISIDPGFTNPLSCHFCAVNEDGDIYVVAEHYKSEWTVERHSGEIWRIAKELNWRKAPNGGLLAIIDPAANQKTLAAEKSVKQLFSDHKIYCKDANNDVWSGIQRVKEYLKPRPTEQPEVWPKGKPRLFIFRTCSNLIKEFKSYRWSEPKEDRNADEKPIKKKDHAMDDLRYFIMSRPQANEKPRGKPKGFYTPGELEDAGYKKLEIRRAK